MPRRTDTRAPTTLVVMVPGIGITAADFGTHGLTDALHERGRPIALATVDPGLDTDPSLPPDAAGSIECRLLAGITQARHAAGADRVWLAGISLGCQAILRCVRHRPGLADGVILLTPYLASTGLIATIARAGGLRAWSSAPTGRDEPRPKEPGRALLTWLATTPRADLPRMLVGRALADRFAPTATLLADLLPPDHLISVPGDHDWTSWRTLWRQILDRDPFALAAEATP